MNSLKRFRFFVPLLTFVLCLGVILSSTLVNAASIHKARIGEHPDKTRLVIELSQKVESNVFTLSGPDRLVIDFKSSNVTTQNLNLPANKTLSFLRQSKDSSTSRYVFALKKSMDIKSKFFLSASAGKPNRLVIDLIPAASKALKTAKTSVIKAPTTRVAEPKTFNIPKSKAQKSQSYKKYTVVLDPGHGGRDPGAVGINKKYEKDIVLAAAKRLKKLLDASGRYNVIMTRSDDRYIKLHERVRIARRHNADLFVSIHADSVESNKVSGASVYTLSEKASSKTAARLAARENKSDVIAGVDLTDEGDDVATILIDLAMRDTKNQSSFLANQFVDAFKAHDIKMLRTPRHSAGFAVLKAPDIPSVLVEIGFMSNPVEAQKLTTVAHQKRIVKALKASIDSYFSKQAYYTAQ